MISSKIDFKKFHEVECEQYIILILLIYLHQNYQNIFFVTKLYVMVLINYYFKNIYYLVKIS
jgi:hypothetical protein